MLWSVSHSDPNSVAVSNSVPPQSRFPIVGLESGTKYELRVTAYNNAGSTQAEYLFNTLSPTGSNRIHDEHPPETEETSLFFDAHVLAPSMISLFAVFLAVGGVCFCLKTRKSLFAGRSFANVRHSQLFATKFYFFVWIKYSFVDIYFKRRIVTIWSMSACN